MQHILNIAFDFDDEKVKKVAENTVENELDRIIKDIVTDKIAPMKYNTWRPNERERDWSGLHNTVKDTVETMINEHKDEIIELAADKLVKSIKSTKAWRSTKEEIMKEMEIV